MDANRRILECESLDDLIAELDAIARELAEGFTIDNVIDCSDLPTFGGPEIQNTAEVWSWDATRILVCDNNGQWAIQPRCGQCGEAPFHCACDRPSRS